MDEIPTETWKKIQDSMSEWYVAKKIGEQDYYIGVVDGKLGWTTDRRSRLKLSREEDAQAIEKMFFDAQLIVQISVSQGGQ